MKKKSFISKSPSETQAVAGRLARLLAAGDVLLFKADLGAGKTTFAQGVAKALGAKDRALSPTFVVAETIEAKIPIHHLDFYRLTKKEILGIGIQDYLTGSGEIAPGIVLIEWAERFPEIWPKNHLEVRIGIQRAAESRRIEMMAHGSRFEDILGKLKAQ